MKHAAILFLVIVLSGCPGLSKQQTAFNAWAGVCDSYAAALVAVAPLVANGSIAAGSDKDQIRLDAQAVIGPQCKDGPPDTDQKPTAVILDALLKLEGLIP